MKRVPFCFLSASLAISTLTGCGPQQSTETSAPSRRFVSIGTGSLTGVYYPTGNAIARMVHAQKTTYGIQCTVESTAGSVFNVNALSAGDLDFAIVQSDVQYQSWHGTGDWAKRGPQQQLRAVFSIHPELVSLVAADDSGIRNLGALAGKRVNIGNPGSGQRVNALDALAQAGIDPETDLQAEGIKASEAPSLLQDGRIDAFFYTVGHPNGALKEATAGTRTVHFVPLAEVAAALCKSHPYYVQGTIPIRHYPKATNHEDVPTFGVKATFMTRADVDADIVYAVTREVFEHLDTFRTLHPAYADLTPEAMLRGLSAPLHDGALRYYREAGLK